MKIIYSIVVGFLMPIFLIAQEKPPETTDDYASILAGDTISVNVLLNDWGMEGHTIVIFFAWNAVGGEVSHTDSIITYYSYYYSNSGLDSVKYIIKDLDNGLMSEPGYLKVEIDNPGRDNLDINNVSAMINSYGLQFWDFKSGSSNLYEVPKGNRTKTIFNFSLWMGGLDGNDELKLAGEIYRLSGIDYWSGPVSDNYYHEDNLLWNNLWKLNKTDIEYHKEHWMDVGYELIDNIKNWPAHGDINNGQAYFMAPFYDYDGDENYIAQNGDSPIIRGDQSMFFVYNDDRDDHTESNGQKLGVEIHGQAYAFDCTDDSVFNNSIFFHYDIINRSDTAYHDFYLGAFVDFDLGNPYDGYVGCDTLLQSFYVYNGDEYDENTTLWNPDTTFGYLDYPPAQGVVFLNTELNSFLTYYGYHTPTWNPTDAPDFYLSLKGLWKDGTPITYGGNGYGGDTIFMYMYPGNPLNSDEWSEVSAGNIPYFRNGMGATGPYYLVPGDTIQIDLAFVFARDYQGDNLSSVSLLKERIAQLRWYYDNDSTPCGESWSGINSLKDTSESLIIYPNPVSDYLNLYFNQNQQKAEYTIYNLLGRKVKTGIVDMNNKTIFVKNLRKGYYLLKINTENRILSGKFNKY